MNRTYKFFVIGFPLYLLGFEMLFNFVSEVDLSVFFAPSIAASGLGLMLNGLKRKELVISDEQLKEIQAINPDLDFNIIDKKDDILVSITWISLLIGILIWYSSCSGIHFSKIDLLHQNLKTILPYALGTLNYVGGALITFLKD